MKKADVNGLAKAMLIRAEEHFKTLENNHNKEVSTLVKHAVMRLMVEIASVMMSMPTKTTVDCAMATLSLIIRDIEEVLTQLTDTKLED